MLDELKESLENEAVLMIRDSAAGIPEEFVSLLSSCVTHSDHLELSLLACASAQWCGGEPGAGMPVAVSSLMLRAGLSVQMSLPGFAGITGLRSPDIPSRDPARAILAGDALLALAMENLALQGGRHSTRLLDEAVKAVGARGVLAGLSLEVDEKESDSGPVPDGRAPWEVSSGQIARFSAMGGALMTGASGAMLDDAAQLGLMIGRARHLVDISGASQTAPERKNAMFQARTLMEQAEVLAGHSEGSTLLKSLIYFPDFI